MKQFPSHSNKRPLIKIALASLLLITLTGCAGGTSPVDAAPAESETEIDQLKEENEKLRKELEDALTNFEEAQERAAQDEDTDNSVDGLNAESETQDGQAETVSSVTDIAPRQLTQIERLAGEWFYQDFHEDGFFSFIQSFVFHTDGTGTLNRTYYVPREDAEEQLALGLFLDDFDTALTYSWSLDGDNLQLILETGEVGDFTFSPDQQRIVNANDTYVRERPSVLENYVERCLFKETGAVQAQKASVRNSFLGTWYFDVLTWTFNDDGTGVLDIPKLGDQPASTREFTYLIDLSLDGLDVTYVCLIVDWNEGSTSYFYPERSLSGEVFLTGSTGSDSIKLTRDFDPGNCPISAAILSANLGLLTGTMFSDLLPY